MPGLRPRERADAFGRQRHAHPRTPDARPRQPRADAVAAVPVHRARPDAGENRVRARLVGRVYARGRPLFGFPFISATASSRRRRAGYADRGRRIFAHHSIAWFTPLTLSRRTSCPTREALAAASRAPRERVGDLSLDRASCGARARARGSSDVHRVPDRVASDVATNAATSVLTAA